jgi:hypothetical protein
MAFSPIADSRKDRELQNSGILSRLPFAVSRLPIADPKYSVTKT